MILDKLTDVKTFIKALKCLFFGLHMAILAAAQFYVAESFQKRYLQFLGACFEYRIQGLYVLLIQGLSLALLQSADFCPKSFYNIFNDNKILSYLLA